MGSLIDLNLVPDAPSSMTNNAISAIKIPKLEPKLEPIDEPLAFSFPRAQPHAQSPSFVEPRERPFSTPTPNPNPSIPSPSPRPEPLQLTPFSSDQNPSFLTPLSQSPATPSDIYSEYERLKEVFKTAFSRNRQAQDQSHPYGGAPVPEDHPDSRAIVPVPDESQVAAVVIPRKRTQRSSELVRVTNLGAEDERHFRNLVRRTRMLFDSLRVLSAADEERRAGGVGMAKRLRGDLRASSLLKDRDLWLNRDKRIVGSIPGVYIGDVFFFRMELCVVGLHGQVQAGIDYVPASQSSNREPIATSVIVSGGYEDDEDAGDVVIYTGHGGQDKFSRQSDHQRLEGGNLALERSMTYGIEVRVIRGIKYHGSFTTSSKVYVYDGLYKITDCWFDVGKSGFGVYKYKLVRIEGQPEMGSSVLKLAAALKTKPLEARPNGGHLSFDISRQKENCPVVLFNDIDDDHEPLDYDYLVRTVFPPYAFHHSGNRTGCGCVTSCGEGCFCAMKNGGEFAYDSNGLLLRGKPLVFECGPFCQCPPQCRNRISQHGLKHRLEVFRSHETGWAVRSLDLIQAGSFICEYTGVILTREQAHVVSMNGDNLVYPHRFSDRWAEWGDLSQIFPDYVRPSFPQVPAFDFAIDVSKMRNVACYMTHSLSPNVMVQFVLYDHNNAMFPHIMLFAMENIPPLRELSIDYGVTEEFSPKLSICN